MLGIIITVGILEIVTFLIGYGVGRASLTPLIEEEDEEF